MPTPLGDTDRVRSLPPPVTVMPPAAATDSLDDETVTVSSLAPYSESATVIGSVRFVGSPKAAARVFSAAVMVGSAGGVPPEPIVVPGAKATPRNASFAGAVAISTGTPLSVPLTPLTSAILYRVPALPAAP